MFIWLSNALLKQDSIREENVNFLITWRVATTATEELLKKEELKDTNTLEMLDSYITVWPLASDYTKMDKMWTQLAVSDWQYAMKWRLKNIFFDTQGD